MAALRERNQELHLQKERYVEENAVEMAALRERNQELKQEKERSVEEKVDKKENEVKVEPGVRHNVKMNALEIEQKVLRGNYEELNMKYEKFLKMHEKDKAEMATLQKANQEFEQQKERCVEEKDAEIAALLKENQTLKQEKEHCVEEEAKVDKKENEVKVEPEVRHNVKINALKIEQKVLRGNYEELNMKYEKLLKMHQNDKAEDLKQLEEPCVKEKDAEMAALQKTNLELKQEKLRCVEMSPTTTKKAALTMKL
ncbi:girdin-like [Gymnodraco acuticeps]|uniref:Girdin-like n=1 Tax=Gymnodraco acuticeps TaxID=8218 RepID=A0A6P8TXH6_GYMAC|nr:girdin-like [Gymnodraco acuticeps]